MRMDVPAYIQKLPLPVIQRMKLERKYIICIKWFKKFFCSKKNVNIIYYPLVRNNRSYGNEYLLRNYSGYNDYLYGIIEHGLFFGNNSVKIGLKHEWELGCILTSGHYRKNLIEKYFPNYKCEMIGPMIYYAKTDKAFQNELKKKINLENRTLVYFPIHGSQHFYPVFDSEKTLQKVIKAANKKNCKNIIICSFFDDINHYSNIISKFEEFNYNIQVTSCGNRFDQNFLERQKSLIELADITLSNSLGTHIGYCIFMNKPHVLLLEEDMEYKGNKLELNMEFGASNRSQNWKIDYEKESEMFRNLFKLSNDDNITKEQLELCNYYWGFSEIKSPEELAQIFYECKIYSNDFLRFYKSDSNKVIKQE